MSNRDIEQLYTNMTNPGYKEPVRTRLNDLYSLVYESADDGTDEDGTVTLYYTTDLNLGKTLDANASVEKFKMSKAYFDKKILGRLDELTYKSVKVLVGLAMPVVGKDGKKKSLDKVALRGLYDVFADHHVTGDQSKILSDRVKNSQDDFLSKAITNLKTGSIVLPVINILADNLRQLLGKSLDVSNINNFLNDLWNVKDVTGRTSVGRGELAMSMLSVGIKGEPGDVKMPKNKNESPDMMDIENKEATARLTCDGAAIEVKGSGGRPGKGKVADKFIVNVLKLLPKNNNPTERKSYRDSDQAAQDLVDNNQETVKSYHMTGQQALDEIKAGLERFSTPGRFSADFRKYLETLPDAPDVTEPMRIKVAGLMDYLNQSQNFNDLAKLPAATSWINMWIEQYTELFAAPVEFLEYLKTLRSATRVPPKTILSGQSHPLGPNTSNRVRSLLSGKKEMLIFRILYDREFIVGDERILLNSMTGKFMESVKTYFYQLIYDVNQNTIRNLGDLKKIPEVNATIALWQTRADGDNTPCPDGVIDYVSGLLKEDPKLFVNHLPHLVGATQMTAYCMADKFTHAMFVNDKTVEKSSLVVACDASDPGATFKGIFEAFVENEVDVNMSIDAQNKGVQITFNQ